VQFDTSVGSRDAEEQEDDGGIAPCLLKWGATWAEVPSWVISWFIKIDLKKNYCSYSRCKIIQNGFL